MSDTWQAVVGIGGGLIFCALVFLAVGGFGIRQQRNLERLNAEERAKFDRYALEHELGFLPCSDPHCSACVYGGTYLPPLRMEWVLR